MIDTFYSTVIWSAAIRKARAPYEAETTIEVEWDRLARHYWGLTRGRWRTFLCFGPLIISWGI